MWRKMRSGGCSVQKVRCGVMNDEVVRSGLGNSGEWVKCGGKCRPLPLFNSIKNFTPFPPRSTTPPNMYKGLIRRE